MATRRLLLALLLSAASTASATDPDHYSPAERDEAIDKALHGDGRASADLSMYFAYKMFDTQESHFWLKLSAEQGYCEGIIGMAGLMDNQQDHEQVRKWVGVAEVRHCGLEDERIAHDMVLFRDEATRDEAATPAVASQGEQAYDLSSTFDLDAAELERIRQLAVRGDAAASHRISDYYLWGYNQVEEGWFWLRLAAEQGDCDAAVGYAGQAEGPMRRPEVATRWLDRAEAMGCAKDPRQKMFIDGLRDSIGEHASSPASRSDALPGVIELPNQVGKQVTSRLDVKKVLTTEGWCLFRGRMRTMVDDDAFDAVVAFVRETAHCDWRADRPYSFAIGLEPAEVEAILKRRHSLLAGLDAWQGMKVDKAFAELRAKVAADELPLSLFREGGDVELDYHVVGMQATVSVKQEGERLVITKLGFGYAD